MRRGHVKQIARPKTGKAAMWAEIQGQGREVSKGRAVFKRSVNDGSRMNYTSYMHIKTKASKRHTWQHDIPRDIRDYNEGYCCCDEAVSRDIKSLYCCWEDDDIHNYEDEEQWVWAPMDCYAPINNNAKIVAANSKKLTEVDRLAIRLKPCGAVLEEKEHLEGNHGFIELQKKFLMDYGPSFCTELSRSMKKIIHVRPAPVSADVQKRFLDARTTLTGTLKPGYHGTNIDNLSSIYKAGLQIPGQGGNNIKVANGSAHGLGIYVAEVSNPHLSWGFCRAPEEIKKKMMVCGILDDSPHSIGFNSYTMGIRTVSSESKNIRHVDSAIVIFDDRRIAPLFEVSLGACLALPAPEFFNWARWLDKVHRILSLMPVKKPKSRVPLMRHQVKQRTVVAYLTRRGACKRSSKSSSMLLRRRIET